MKTSFMRLALFLSFATRVGMAGDYYVATVGDDSLGTGDLQNPWKTITHAMDAILPSINNPHTIHVASGLYSPSTTGEMFPLNPKSYVTLLGAGRSMTILDAEVSTFDQGRRVIHGVQVEHVTISGFTLTGGAPGLFSDVYYGGCILLDQCRYMTIRNNRIVSNTVQNCVPGDAYGGGIACLGGSHILIDGNVIESNSAITFMCMKAGLGDRHSSSGFAGHGGLYLASTRSMVVKNIFTSNSASSVDVWGSAGGLGCIRQAVVLSNYFTSNLSMDGAALVVGDSVALFRNTIVDNQAVYYGAVTSWNKTIIGGSPGNGNHIYNNSGQLGRQLYNSYASEDSALATHNYFATANPLDSTEIRGRFRIEPRSSTPIAFDTMSLVGVPSPIAFDSVDILTTSVRNFVLFNVFPSLVDSIIVYDVIHSHPSFLTEEMSFTIPAQERRVVEVAFSPDDPGWHHDTISIFTNVGQLCLYANGIGKGAPANVGRDVKGTSFRLKPIYPNPLNASASISYVLPRTGHVRIKILDVLGREVVILLDHQEVAGDHSIHWQGLDRRHRRVASGVYFVVAEWEGWRHVGKLLFVK